MVGADPEYKGILCRNPASERHVTIHNHRVYSLDELADYIAVTPKEMRAYRRYWRINHANAQMGRNCFLFENSRQWAYENVNSYGSLDAFNKAVFDYINALNLFRFRNNPLPQADIRATAKSISKWTWKHKDNFVDRKPKLTPEQVKEKQRQAALNTAKYRRTKTVQKIQKAIYQLAKSGKKISKAGVARIVNISRQKLSEEYAYLFENVHLSSPTIRVSPPTGREGGGEIQGNGAGAVAEIPEMVKIDQSDWLQQCLPL